MIDRDEPIRECYAYSMDGQKCSHPAGHPGDHAIIITWGDDECWKPGSFTTLPVVTTQPEPVLQHLVSVPKTSGKCVICSHRMHTGPCGQADGEFDCDCSNGVEE